jgi:hypothetical protein
MVSDRVFTRDGLVLQRGIVPLNGKRSRIWDGVFGERVVANQCPKWVGLGAYYWDGAV